MLQFMGSQRVGHNWATELNWSLDFLDCIRVRRITPHRVVIETESPPFTIFSTNVVMNSFGFFKLITSVSKTSTFQSVALKREY